MNEFVYYVSHENQKRGPLTIEEIKNIKLTPHTLVWRNDSPDWLPATSFSELSKNIIELPPLLPVEKFKIQKTNNFEQTKTKLLKYYLILSAVITILSSFITIISYNNWPGKGHESDFGPNTRLSYTLRYTDPSIGWHPYRNNETVYSEEQIFILRPLYPFFSTAYLSSAEQENSILVFGKQLVSTFILFATIFLVILGITYFQKQNN